MLKTSFLPDSLCINLGSCCTEQNDLLTSECPSHSLHPITIFLLFESPGSKAMLLRLSLFMDPENVSNILKLTFSLSNYRLKKQMYPI